MLAGLGVIVFRVLRRFARYIAARMDARAKAVVSDAVNGTPVVREIRNDVKTITGQVGDLSTRVRSLETRTNREENARPGGRRWSDPDLPKPPHADGDD